MYAEFMEGTKDTLTDYLRLLWEIYIWGFKLVREGIRTGVSKSRKAWSTLPRCGVCGAQGTDLDVCKVCSKIEFAPTRSKLRLMLSLIDFLPKLGVALAWIITSGPAAIVFLSLVSFAFTSILGFTAEAQHITEENFLSGDSLDSYFRIGVGVALFLIFLPLVFVFGLAGFYLWAWTAKHFLLNWDELVSDLRSLLGFTGLASLQILALSIVSPFGQGNAGPFWGPLFGVLSWGLVFTQVAIAIVGWVIALLRRVVGPELYRSLNYGYVANILTNHQVIGRPGSSLDTSDLDNEATQVGQVGEQITSAAIEGLMSVGNANILFNSLRVPGMPKADLDHVVLIGNLVIIADSKNWRRGSYEVVQGNVWRDGQPFEGGSVAIGLFRLALEEYLESEGGVQARVVLVNQEAQVNGQQTLEPQCRLTGIEEFLDEIVSQSETVRDLPTARTISLLISLSEAHDKPSVLNRLISKDDSLLVDLYLRRL